MIFVENNYDGDSDPPGSPPRRWEDASLEEQDDWWKGCGGEDDGWLSSGWSMIRMMIMMNRMLIRTNSQIRDTVLCRSVTKNLTDYRFNSAGWGLNDMKAEIHSFPTMYIIGGGKWGRNGSKLRFSQKKWPKNSFFEGHKSGSTDFGGVWHPYFWRYR